MSGIFKSRSEQLLEDHNRGQGDFHKLGAILSSLNEAQLRFCDTERGDAYDAGMKNAMRNRPQTPKESSCAVDDYSDSDERGPGDEEEESLSSWCSCDSSPSITAQVSQSSDATVSKPAHENIHENGWEEFSVFVLVILGIVALVLSLPFMLSLIIASVRRGYNKRSVLFADDKADPIPYWLEKEKIVLEKSGVTYKSFVERYDKAIERLNEDKAYLEKRRNETFGEAIVNQINLILEFFVNHDAQHWKYRYHLDSRDLLVAIPIESAWIVFILILYQFG